MRPNPNKSDTIVDKYTKIMAGSLDNVLQPDGTYKWEVTELKPKTQETAEVCSCTKSN